MIKRIMLLVVFSALLIAGLAYFWPFQSDSLSIQAAGERAQALYGGTIENTEEKNGHYIVQMRKNEQFYQIQMDNADGTVLSMNTVKEKEQRKPEKEADSEKEQEGEKPDNNKGKQDVPDNSKKTQEPSDGSSEDASGGLITAVEASRIVLENVEDKAVNSSIEAELDEDDDRRIYDIELELKDEREVEAEVDAVTGKVLYFYEE